MYRITVIFAAIAIVAGIVAVSAIVAQASRAQSDSESTAMLGGNSVFASVTTEITDEQIIITIQKNPNVSAGVPGELPPPDTPIIVIPPNETSGENVTIIPIPPINESSPGGGGNVTIIEPGGNISIIEDGNATIIDNDTAVIVSPPDRNVTETPGDVVVIDPPVEETPPATGSNNTECTCPPVTGVPGAPPDIQLPPGNQSMISNNTNITINEPAPPEPAPVEPLPPVDENEQQGEESNDNGGGGNGGGDGGSSNDGGSG